MAHWITQHFNRIQQWLKTSEDDRRHFTQKKNRCLEARAGAVGKISINRENRGWGRLRHLWASMTGHLAAVVLLGAPLKVAPKWQKRFCRQTTMTY
ncbi:hypothetical protein CEXT_30981 [Caerostris extrusa]|uniref:Uncharacterized protein n=1 Tax=Caerostris extrusa TaxID=172846 RepID=A0AAV4WPL4_CAEEX|nr:hypothetical protein CEXT_30981 [Caerostris extrusa]